MTNNMISLYYSNSRNFPDKNFIKIVRKSDGPNKKLTPAIESSGESTVIKLENARRTIKCKMNCKMDCG